MELNAFYLKYFLWFPPTEPINTYRLTLFFFCGLVGVREAYRYLADRFFSLAFFSSSNLSFFFFFFFWKLFSKCKRLGSQAWVCIAIIQTETLLCIKWGKGHFQEPAPPHVIWFWIIFSILFVGFTVIRFSPLKKYFFPRRSSFQAPKKEN